LLFFLNRAAQKLQRRRGARVKLNTRHILFLLH
jgi:hypothetical protein